MKEEIMSKISDAVKSEIGTECEIKFPQIKKNNEMELQAVVICVGKESVCPVIYIDYLMAQIAEGEITCSMAAKEIVDIYMQSKDSKDAFDIVGSLNKRYILDNVTYKIINAEKNKWRLDEIPNRSFLDLAVTYEIVINGELGNARIEITNLMCNNYSISEKELDAAARKNTEERGFAVQTMEAVMAEMTGVSKESISFGVPQMWVLSSTTMLSGASIMLYTGYFDILAKKLGSDLYVIPSSIHEVIAVPTCGVEPDNIRHSVAEVNSNCVSPDEILSENVYRYSRERGELIIA